MATGVQATTPEEILARCSLFGDLDAAGLKELAARSHRLTVDANRTIFEVGSPGQSLMAVLKGEVRISLPSATGKEMILADLVAGDVFGEIALLDGRPRSASAIATQSSVLLVLDRREVHAFLRKRPDFCLTVIELLCARLRRSDERMADIAFLDLATRLARVIVNRSSQNKTAGAVLPYSQSELAKMVGATRENVNRCLKEWQRQGIIALKEGRVSIPSMKAIRALTSQDD